MAIGAEPENVVETKLNNIRDLVPNGYVGFDCLPEQYVNRTIRNGIVFNIMVIGGTGVGKSTLIDSLFNTTFNDACNKSHNRNTVELSVNTHELQEKQIKLKLTVVETRGFGDQINKENCYKSIVEYIDAQFENYLQEELKVHRNNNLSCQDTRIHCCLYIISPVGHGLRSIDLVTLKKLDSKVNLIPIIGKSDMITKDELCRLRAVINSEFNENGIRIYNFQTDDTEAGSQINGLLPFAIVASHDFVRLGNRQIRARQYPWGTVQVESEAHCDFLKLREMLLSVNMEDLRDTTNTVHYELYRRTRLEQMGFGDISDVPKTSTFQETFEARRNAQKASLKKKEDEIRQALVEKVKEKEAEIKNSERELAAKYEALKKYYQEEKKKIEIEKAKLDAEIIEFHQQKTVFLQSTSISQSTTSLASSLSIGKNKKK